MGRLVGSADGLFVGLDVERLVGAIVSTCSLMQ